MSFLARLLPLGGGLFLGWTLGANDTANIFGTAVATRNIRLRSALLLCSVMVILGAALQGAAGIRTLSGITEQSLSTALVVSLSAAITATIMTFLGLPISTSQAVVGAILGIGLASRHTEYGGLIKVVLCWVGTPIGSMLIALVVHKFAAGFFHRIPMSIFTRDKILWSGLVIVGTYGAYALGANNVANTMGMYSGLIPGLSDQYLAAIGGVAIAVGAIKFSRNVIYKVGSGIMRLDAFTALVAVLSMSLTVHVFALIGAPVSTSQGIVGSILGIGLLRGAHAIRFRMLREITVGWLLTPAISLVLAAAGYAIFA